MAGPPCGRKVMWDARKGLNNGAQRTAWDDDDDDDATVRRPPWSWWDVLSLIPPTVE
jgi:hypothetical protein